MRLRDDGTPVLDYPLTPYVWDGVRRAFAAMAEIQFAAGAKSVCRCTATVRRSRVADGRARRDRRSSTCARSHTPVVSAHVMGGAPLGPDPRRAVVGDRRPPSSSRNLYVCDGSLFPTSIGANPQLSIYGFAPSSRRRSPQR